MNHSGKFKGRLTTLTTCNSECIFFEKGTPRDGIRGLLSELDASSWEHVFWDLSVCIDTKSEDFSALSRLS